MFDHEMIDPSKQIHYFRQGQSSEYVPQSDTFFGGKCLEMVGRRPERVALASILGPFRVQLLKFTLDTHPSSLMHYFGLLEFPVRICDALHITTHTRRT